LEIIIAILNKRTDRGSKFLGTETFILEDMKMIFLKDTANIIGQVEPIIEAVSCRE
jgi:hypothetical protein